MHQETRLDRRGFRTAEGKKLDITGRTDTSAVFNNMAPTSSRNPLDNRRSTSNAHSGGQDARTHGTQTYRGSGHPRVREPEPRERGIISNVIKTGQYGFIKCADRDVDDLWFHFCFFIDDQANPNTHDEVEFSVGYNYTEHFR
jgi:hypothetical protein